MIKKIGYLIAIAILCINNACSDESIYKDPSKDGYYLNVSNNNIVFSADNNLESTINIESFNVKWKLTCAQPWVSLSKTEGNSNEKITVKVAPNSNIEKDRSATITLMSEERNYTYSKEITITQSAIGYHINVSKTYITAEANQSEYSISVDATAEWKFSTLDTWIHCSRELNNLKISVDENKEIYSVERTGYVNVSCGTASVNLKVIQIAQPMKDGHECVDLGLPSGLLWATYNVGASSDEEFGDYFAWGETETKETFEWENYKYGYDQTFHRCSKYNVQDGKRTLEPSDDVAVTKWGGSWHMPTLSEMEELIKECTYEWTNINGINGMKFIGKNKNILFMPASFGLNNSQMYYWTSTANSDYSAKVMLSALMANTGKYHLSTTDFPRFTGYPVRPVADR